MAGKKSLMRLKKFIVKLRICMQLLHQIMPLAIERNDGSTLVPEGHFTVMAGESVEEEENRRFVIELKYLKSPALLKLFKQAEEEYGFNQQGALVLPCTPEELRKILQSKV